MLLDRESQLKIENFNKYAKFISEKFGVIVRMDGAKAMTDGNTIFIPNIAGMDNKEIDFLYSILLHEVGHIRYSTFTKEAFEKLKTDAHVSMSNSIEDARIENLLMKDFDGAHDIFSKFYNVHVLDKNFMTKVFGHDLSQGSEWDNLGCYVHDRIIRLNEKFTFEKLLKKQMRLEITKFVEKNKIDELIDSSPLKTWDDVVALSNKIYDLFFKNKKDMSEANDTGKLQKLIDNAMQNGFQEMEQDAKDMQKVLDRKAESIHAKTAVLDEMVKDKEKFRKSIRPKLDEIRAEQKDLAETIKQKKVVAAKDKKIHSSQNKLDAKREKQANIQNKMDEAARELAEEEDEKKQEKLKDKIDKLDAKKDKLNPSINRLKKKIEDNQKLMNDAEKRLQNLPDSMTEQSREDLIDQFKENISKKKEMSDKLDAKENQIQNKNMEIHQAVEDYHSTKLEAGKKIANKMNDLEKSLNKEGVPSNIMPKFEKNDDWADADKEQAKFDKKASEKSGDIVTNGAGFSNQNTRDILALIDKTKNDLESIDLAKHFVERNKMSKLESFNDTISEINNTEIFDTEEEAVASLGRKHIAFTTAYDVVKIENTSNGLILDDIKKKNAATLNRVKNIFRQRFKFQKKDRFKGNKEEGGLDVRNLWKLAARQNDDRIFEINNPKLVNKIKASIVVDASGSLDKDYAGTERLQTLALFLSEGLSDCFIQHEAISYTAPVNHIMRKIEKSDVYNRSANHLETIVHRKFEDRHNRGIQNIAVKPADNSDGESIKIAVTRLLKNSSRRKVLFVISDCKPFLSEASIGMLDNHLKETIAWAKTNRVEIYSFSFNKSKNAEAFYGDNHCTIEKWDDLTNFLQKKLV